MEEGYFVHKKIHWGVYSAFHVQKKMSTVTCILFPRHWSTNKVWMWLTLLSLEYSSIHNLRSRCNFVSLVFRWRRTLSRQNTYLGRALCCVVSCVVCWITSSTAADINFNLCRTSEGIHIFLCLRTINSFLFSVFILIFFLKGDWFSCMSTHLWR